MSLLKAIIDRINGTLVGASQTREFRDSLLKGVAGGAWSALFPEGVAQLPKDVIMKRWADVSQQLSAHPNRQKILRILESPASGERFHWLDSPSTAA